MQRQVKDIASVLSLAGPSSTNPALTCISEDDLECIATGCLSPITAHSLSLIGAVICSAVHIHTEGRNAGTMSMHDVQDNDSQAEWGIVN